MNMQKIPTITYENIVARVREYVDECNMEQMVMLYTAITGEEVNDDFIIVWSDEAIADDLGLDPSDLK